MTKMNNAQVDNGKDFGVVMPMLSLHNIVIFICKRQKVYTNFA